MHAPTPVPLNRPFLAEAEEQAVLAALRGGRLQGDGPWCRQAEKALVDLTGSAHAFVVTSGSHALELALAVLDVGPGDEVVTPSFTFPSALNAILNRGARPVFADIRPDTLVLDPEDVARVSGPATRVVLPVSYGGVGVDAEALREAAGGRAMVLEDAAHSVGARIDGRHVGTTSDVAILSFHETKNITCGEGGAVLVQDDALARRLEVLREKGTNRAAFRRGEVPHYEWVDVGYSMALSDLLAALLCVQIDKAMAVAEARRAVRSRYDDAFADLVKEGALRPQIVPDHCEGNGHLYAARVADRATRDALLGHLGRAGIEAAFHFVPLHTTAFARSHLGEVTERPLPITEDAGQTLVRLPILPDLSAAEQARVVAAVRSALGV